MKSIKKIRPERFKLFRLKGILPIYLLLIITLFLNTCHKPPVAKYHLLSESSQSMLSVTLETYLRIEKLQHQFTVVTADRYKPISRDTFKPLIDGHSFDLIPELRFRETAMEVLVDYFKVLQALAERDFVNEVDRAAEKLAGSLKNLTESSEKQNQSSARQTVGLLASGINAIGRALVHKKRIKALKCVMDSSQVDLVRLARLITGTNKKIKRFVNLMLERIIAHANITRPEYNHPQRFIFDLRIADTMNEVETVNKALNTLSQAINEIPTAHAAVRKMLDKKPETWATLLQLTKDINRIGKCYR